MGLRKNKTMPRGIYQHKKTPAVLAMIAKNFAKGRTKEVQARARESLRVNGKRPEFRLKMSRIVTRNYLNPAVKKRHDAGVMRFVRKNGASFRGGNGQPPTAQVEAVAKILEPMGFERELPIKTRFQTTPHKVPRCYKADFGHRSKKIAVELDGQCHKPKPQQAKDRKKTEVLQSLGWKVIRIQHGKEVNQTHFAAILAEF